MSPTVIASSLQHCSFSILWKNQQICFSAIYASTTCLRRKELWRELSDLTCRFLAHWIYIGDFNTVLGAHEKRGGNLPLKQSYEDFHAWTDLNRLTHVLTGGSPYTWSNGRAARFHTEMRLDRAIINEDCFLSSTTFLV